MMTINLLIVDDTLLVNQGICSLLQAEQDMAVVGNALNGQQALTFLREKKVDVVLLDHHMPGKSGLQTLQQIRGEKLPVKVILLTLLEDKSLIKSYMEVGIEGCMLKQDNLHEFTFGIRQVFRGEQFFSSSVAKVLAGQSSTPARPLVEKSTLVASLTKAEWQVLALIANGYSVEEISDLRHTSTKTVSRQKQNIMDKLNIHKETKLMRFAIDQGIE